MNDRARLKLVHRTKLSFNKNQSMIIEDWCSNEEWSLWFYSLQVDFEIQISVISPQSLTLFPRALYYSQQLQSSIKLSTETEPLHMLTFEKSVLLPLNVYCLENLYQTQKLRISICHLFWQECIIYIRPIKYFPSCKEIMLRPLDYPS